MEVIQQLVDAIVARWHPDKVILFGSWAKGWQTEESDVDLMVVLPFDCSQTEMYAEILDGIKTHFPLDLVVITPSMLEQQLAKPNWFYHAVLNYGLVLHDA